MLYVYGLLINIRYRIAGIFRGYKCSWFSQYFYPRTYYRMQENLSNGLSAKVYTLKIYPLYGGKSMHVCTLAALTLRLWRGHWRGGSSQMIDQSHCSCRRKDQHLSRQPHTYPLYMG